MSPLGEDAEKSLGMRVQCQFPEAQIDNYVPGLVCHQPSFITDT